MYKRFFASFLGTIPGVIILLLASNGFATVGPVFQNNLLVMGILIFAMFVLWVGMPWLISQSNEISLMDYTAKSAALFSSIIGITPGILTLITPTV